jgi:hypothetical protein
MLVAVSDRAIDAVRSAAQVRRPDVRPEWRSGKEQTDQARGDDQRDARALRPVDG